MYVCMYLHTYIPLSLYLSLSLYIYIHIYIYIYILAHKTNSHSGIQACGSSVPQKRDVIGVLRADALPPTRGVASRLPLVAAEIPETPNQRCTSPSKVSVYNMLQGKIIDYILQYVQS